VKLRKLHPVNKLEEFSNNPTLNDRIFKAFSRFFFHDYLHIEEENKKLKYESELKDEEIAQLSEELRTLKQNPNEDLELFDMLDIHSSSKNVVQIIKKYLEDKKKNPVYYQLVTKVMKLDFLSEKLGIKE
jgi:hypothetical protein